MRATQQIRPAALRAHVSFLADDLLEGRGTATRGHEIAARYIAAQLDAAGLEPGSDGTWLQQVPLRRSSLDPEASSIEIIRRNGERTALAFGSAVGALLLWTPVQEKSGSWGVVVRSLSKGESFAWLDSGAPHGFHPELRGHAWLGLNGSRALFDDDKTFSEVTAKATPAELPVRARIVTRSRIADVQSPNVVGLLRGSDPRLRDEYVVLTAHADHLGIGEPVEGDSIYNGVVDNASGVAALLELARAFASLPERPRRSLLFVAVTGEEPGLLGSSYFVHHPPVPREAMVGALNIDGVSVWPFDSLVPRGAEHSTLARAVEAAVEAAGFRTIADPFPDRMLFLGSDQYSFVKSGIPALIVGTLGSGDARAMSLQWFRTRYHAPSDDLSQPLDFEATAQLTRNLFLIGYAIAQDEERPRWNPGDFYGRHFGQRYHHVEVGTNSSSAADR